MKKTVLYTMLLLAVLVLVVFVWTTGIGYRASGSAMLDLKAELAEIHGEPYEGREVEGGTEDMEFSVRPTDWLFTDGRFRQAVGWDYHYRCEVIYTSHGADGRTDGRKIVYTGIDPMGKDEETVRAHLVTDQGKSS